MEIVLIPKNLSISLDSEVMKSGIDPSEVKFELKWASVDYGVLINWQVSYTNRSGRKDFVPYLYKSGKSLVLNSPKPKLIDFRASDYLSFELGGEIELEVNSEISRGEAREFLLEALSESLRVPKSSVKVLNAETVLIARKLKYSLKLGDREIGEAELSERGRRVSLKPIPLEELEATVLESLKNSDQGAGRRIITRSWDALFDKKKASVGIEILARGSDDGYANFIVKMGGELELIRVNRYSGTMNRVKLPGLEEMRRNVIREISRITSVDPSMIELSMEDIARSYRVVERDGETRVSFIMTLTINFVVLNVSYDASSGEVHILSRKVDEGALKRILNADELDYDVDDSLLYVKSRRGGSWKFSVFKLNDLKGSPDMSLLVERAAYDPKSSGYLLFCKFEGSDACLSFLLKGDEGIFLGKGCLEDVIREAEMELSSKYNLGVSLRLDFERNPSEILWKIKPESLFKGRRGRVNAFLHLNGMDRMGMFLFVVRYSFGDGSMEVEPRILKETVERIVRGAVGGEVRVMSYRYEHPLLQVTVKDEKQLIDLKFDLRDPIHPALVEMKARAGILDRLMGFLNR